MKEHASKETARLALENLKILMDDPLEFPQKEDMDRYMQLKNFLKLAEKSLRSESYLAKERDRKRIYNKIRRMEARDKKVVITEIDQESFFRP